MLVNERPKEISLLLVSGTPIEMPGAVWLTITVIGSEFESIHIIKFFFLEKMGIYYLINYLG